MTVSEGKQFIIDSIQLLYDHREASNIAVNLIEWITGMNRAEQVLNKSVALSQKEEEKLATSSIRLGTGEPMQYVLGEAWFLGNRFKVTKETLIPRPETEELVIWILEEIDQFKDTKISLLDIGTGSGCIPISIQLKAPFTEVRSIDISSNAIVIAKENALLLKSTIEFDTLDFLDEQAWEKLKPMNIIVSNPPYIKVSEKTSMHINVVDHEPHVALFVPDEDALIFYRKILSFSKTHLLPGGSIFLEINEALGSKVVDLFSSTYENIMLKKDFYGKDRMIKINKPY